MCAEGSPRLGGSPASQRRRSTHPPPSCLQAVATATEGRCDWLSLDHVEGEPARGLHIPACTALPLPRLRPGPEHLRHPRARAWSRDKPRGMPPLRRDPERCKRLPGPGQDRAAFPQPPLHALGLSSQPHVRQGLAWGTARWSRSGSIARCLLPARWFCLHVRAAPESSASPAGESRPVYSASMGCWLFLRLLLMCS